MTDKLKYADITGKVLGCGFEVHKYLGNGFQRYGEMSSFG